MRGGIYFNVADLKTQKNGKPHGLPFVNFTTWGSIAPKKKICVSSMRLTTGTRNQHKTKLDHNFNFKNKVCKSNKKF